MWTLSFFEIRNIDLPRKVKYRPRYKQPEFKVDRGCRLGRSYSDFQKFLEKDRRQPLCKWIASSENPGKCLLTVHFVETSFMLAFTEGIQYGWFCHPHLSSA